MAGIGDPAVFRRQLQDWYLARRRELPWRRTLDPWAIWVSEVMLQQTRVEVVRHAFGPFLSRFPDPASLAKASDDEMLLWWAGLGYYRRVRLLRKAAREILADHGGRVPTDPAAFRRLPGVGDYTAGAVLSIAHDLPLPALDANAERVLSRLLALEENPRRGPGRRVLLEALKKLIPDEGAGTFNQALMELGALVCRAKVPRCGACPVRDHCEARSQGRTREIPLLPNKSLGLVVRTEVALVEREDQVLAVRSPRGGVNGGFLDLPGLGLPRPSQEPDGSPGPLARALSQWVEEVPVLFEELAGVSFEVTHSITRYRIKVAVREVDGSKLTPRAGAFFAHPDSETLPWSTVARKVFRRRERPRERWLLQAHYGDSDLEEEEEGGGAREAERAGGGRGEEGEDEDLFEE